jgi:hypothetical protein
MILLLLLLLLLPPNSAHLDAPPFAALARHCCCHGLYQLCSFTHVLHDNYDYHMTHGTTLAAATQSNLKATQCKASALWLHHDQLLLLSSDC